MYNGIINFTHNSTLQTKNLLRSKTRVKIYNSTELVTKKKKKECTNQRLNDLARPNVRRIRSIFERQKKKSKFDMIKAEKLLKLMNEPPKKPIDVRRCIEELGGSKNKQQRMTYSRDKTDERCRQQLRDFKCLPTKKVLLENQYELQYNNSFMPQKHLISNYNKPPRTNNNVTNFKVSTEKNITTQELEQRCRNDNLKPSTFSWCNRTNDNFFRNKPLSLDDSKVCHKSKDLQNIPRSLFINSGTVAVNHTKQATKPNKKSTIRSTTGTSNETAGYNKDSIKITQNKTLSFNKETSSNNKPPKKIDLSSRQRTVTSPKNVSIDRANGNQSNSHSFIDDPILGQAMQIPDFLENDLINNSISHDDEQSIEINSNALNSSSTPIDISSIAGTFPVIQTAANSTINSQLQEQSNGLNSFHMQKYSYPDIYENFSISLLTEDDSSILKLSNNSISQDSPQNFLGRQSSFKKNANKSDFGTFVAKQKGNSSKNFSKLPVIALRDFSGYHDIGIDKDNEILVRVTSANFDKIYVVTKINDEKNLDEFCNNPVSSRSRLFLLNSSKENKEIEIKKLGIKSMKLYCSKDYEESLEEYDRNSLLSSINQEKFSVQKLDITSRRLNNAGIDIHVTENSDKNSNFTVIKEQPHVTHTQKKI